MAVGILLVSHEGIASGLLASARRILRLVPAHVAVVEVPWEVSDAGRAQAQVRGAIRGLDEGEGVLVLADLYGATPFNLVSAHEPGRQVARVSGMNLPMLLRVLNYPEKSLRDLAEIARDGGRAGVAIDG
jgi:PTS system ascorbate-specific IIA component